MLARGLLCAIAPCFAASVVAAEPMQPSGKWVVNFADAQCIATRQYGPADKPIYLALKSPPVGDVLQLGVVWPGGQRGAMQTRGEIAFDNGEPIITNLLEFGSGKLGQRAILVNLPKSRLRPMRTASSIRIRARSTSDLKPGTRMIIPGSTMDQSFGLTQMTSLLQMLDKCTEDLRRVWNVYDPDVPGPLKKPPTGNLLNLFSADDYPVAAIRNEQMGKVSLVLLIDEKGKVADCTVTQTSGVASLDAQSCAILKERGRFSPAIGQDGKPAKSSWMQSIGWMLQR